MQMRTIRTNRQRKRDKYYLRVQKDRGHTPAGARPRLAREILPLRSHARRLLTATANLVICLR